MRLPVPISDLVRKPTRRPWLRRCLWAALALAVAFAVFVWFACGEADKVSRRSTFVVMRHYLLEEARRLGHYPASLQDVEEIKDDWEIREVEYVAGGKPYNPKGNQYLFYEIRSRRYGFDTGWYDFYQREWRFHEGDILVF